MTLSHHHHDFLLHHLPVLVVLFLWYCCSAESANPLGVYCDKNTKIENGDVIDQFLVELVSVASTDGFLATPYVSGENMFYGLAQCRADVSKKDCSSCIRDAAYQIRTRCPTEADARIWFDYCFLRYSKTDFIGQPDTGLQIYYWNPGDVSDKERFNDELGKMLDYLSGEAVRRENLGMGRARKKLSPFVTLYGMVQCTRDLSASDCAQCLATAVSNIPNYCNNKKGCRVIYSSCYTRYELYPFFFPLIPSAKSSSSDHAKMMMTMVNP